VIWGDLSSIDVRWFRFGISELWAKDHMQKERPESVAGDAVQAQNDCESCEDPLAHSGSLSMSLESSHPMRDIFPENKLAVYQ
jgi:hypothetical protein